MRRRHFEALSFIAPFAVSAMVDTANQSWLNQLWDYLTGFRPEAFDYYDNSIKMLNMLILSGNYWDPSADLPDPGKFYMGLLGSRAPGKKQVQH